MSWDLKLVNTNRIHLITTDVQKIKQDFQNQNIKIKKNLFSYSMQIRVSGEKWHYKAIHTSSKCKYLY